MNQNALTDTQKQIERINQHIAVVENQQQLLTQTLFALEELQTTIPTYVKLVPGIFFDVSQKLNEDSQFIIHIGQDVYLKKSLRDVKKDLENELRVTDSHHARVIEEMEKIMNEVEEMTRV